ncbi:hypothetical protein E2C01_070412 [Portunus trituberculatus]|uniref:Uncharacterized protein n=1 Tax=Portunus trituberculatus TaxID=210409 RepID=A0A5B7HSM1_PORTR|nr:hypothetical protein [Portunus trituberculatus]
MLHTRLSHNLTRNTQNLLLQLHQVGFTSSELQVYVCEGDPGRRRRAVRLREGDRTRIFRNDVGFLAVCLRHQIFHRDPFAMRIITTWVASASLVSFVSQYAHTKYSLMSSEV